MKSSVTILNDSHDTATNIAVKSETVNLYECMTQLADDKALIKFRNATSRVKKFVVNFYQTLKDTTVNYMLALYRCHLPNSREVI